MTLFNWVTSLKTPSPNRASGQGFDVGLGAQFQHWAEVTSFPGLPSSGVTLWPQRGPFSPAQLWMPPLPSHPMAPVYSPSASDSKHGDRSPSAQK